VGAVLIVVGSLVNMKDKKIKKKGSSKELENLGK
jgi:hypothetical protein